MPVLTQTMKNEISKNNFNSVYTLLSTRPDEDYSEILAYITLYSDRFDLDLVNQLIEKNQNFTYYNVYHYHYNSNFERNALHGLIKQKNIELFKKLLNKVSSNDNELLTQTVLYVDTSAVKYATLRKLTLIEYAYENDFIEGVIAIVEKFPQVADGRDSENYFNVLRELIEAIPYNLKDPDAIPNFDLITALVNSGIELKTTPQKLSLLHIAIHKNLPLLVELLVSKSDLTCTYGMEEIKGAKFTPLQLARQCGFTNCLNIILKAKFNNKSLLEHLLEISQNVVTKDILALLKDGADINVFGTENPLIHRLVKFRPIPELNKEAIKLLASKNENLLGTQNSNGLTPFKCIINQRIIPRTTDLIFLMHQGVDMTETDADGKTILVKILFLEKELTDLQKEFIEQLVYSNPEVLNFNRTTIFDAYAGKEFKRYSTQQFLFKLKAINVFRDMLSNKGGNLDSLKQHMPPDKATLKLYRLEAVKALKFTVSKCSAIAAASPQPHAIEQISKVLDDAYNHPIFSTHLSGNKFLGIKRMDRTDAQVEISKILKVHGQGTKLLPNVGSIQL